MGVLVRRCTYGAAVQDAKQQLIATISRYNQVLRGGAKISTNVEAKGKLKIKLISQSGTGRRVESPEVDEGLFKDLMKSKSFEIEMAISRKGPTKPRIVFWYDQDTHRGNSLNVEFIGEFPESLTFKLLAFLGKLNVTKANAIRPQTESVLSRIQLLWEDVLRMYVGGAMTKSEQKFNLREYEVDSLFLNIFGNIIKVRED